MLQKLRVSLAGLAALLLIFAAGTSEVQAQQLPVSNNYIFQPKLMNPAAMGTYGLNNVMVGHQQRRLSVAGWRSISQFLNFSSMPLGRSESFGWGALITNDIEWSEFRLGISASIAAQIINTEKMKLGLGISGGLINWGSNYDKVRVFDRSDVLVENPGNFAELDAGIGAYWQYRSKTIRADLGGNTSQMPGNFISEQIQGINILPHVFMGGGILFSPTHNLFIGPRAFYRDIYASGDSVPPGADQGIGGAQLDVGLALELDRQKLWVGGAYRINRGALTLAFGTEILSSDTVGDPNAFGYFIDLNAGFSYPMGESSIFGPSLEIGLNVTFGRKNKNLYLVDTLRYVNGSFWSNEGNLNNHMVKYLKPNGPQGLNATTLVTKRGVTVTYEFDDNSYQYVGNTPVIVSDSLIQELGGEWIGVDAIVENIVSEVIREAIRPDTNNVANSETLEPLKDLISIEVSTDLMVDERAADFGAKGMMYEGEFGTNNEDQDSLFLNVVYNDADTTVGIGRDRHISNLELACLKLQSIRMKLQYEMERQYGNEWAILWEGEEVTADKTQGKKIVYLKKPRITPNNPNQNAFQVNAVKLRFSRFQDGFTSDEDLVVDDEDTDTSKRRKRRRERQRNRERVR